MCINLEKRKINNMEKFILTKGVVFLSFFLFTPRRKRENDFVTDLASTRVDLVF